MDSEEVNGVELQNGHAEGEEVAEGEEQEALLVNKKVALEGAEEGGEPLRELVFPALALFRRGGGEQGSRG